MANDMLFNTTISYVPLLCYLCIHWLWKMLHLYLIPIFIRFWWHIYFKLCQHTFLTISIIDLSVFHTISLFLEYFWFVINPLAFWPNEFIFIFSRKHLYLKYKLLIASFVFIQSSFLLFYFFRLFFFRFFFLWMFLRTLASYPALAKVIVVFIVINFLVLD